MSRNRIGLGGSLCLALAAFLNLGSPVFAAQRDRDGRPWQHAAGFISHSHLDCSWLLSPTLWFESHDLVTSTEAARLRGQSGEGVGAIRAGVARNVRRTENNRLSGGLTPRIPHHEFKN